MWLTLSFCWTAMPYRGVWLRGQIWSTAYFYIPWKLKRVFTFSKSCFEKNERDCVIETMCGQQRLKYLLTCPLQRNSADLSSLLSSRVSVLPYCSSFECSARKIMLRDKSPTNLHYFQHCPKCGGENMRKTLEDGKERPDSLLLSAI